MKIAARERAIGYLEPPPFRPLPVPALVLLDRRGHIDAVDAGWWGHEVLRSAVVTLLAE